MGMGSGWRIAAVAIAMTLSAVPAAYPAARKVHVVGLGATKRVPYSKVGDPAGAATGEDALKIRPLVVDSLVKEWTTGDAHDVTDRSFVVRRVLRLNDSLPGDKAAHWVWQRGPWLLVDRVTGHVTALKLPDYDPGISQVSWFRDYGAYCGLTVSGKNLYAVVAQGGSPQTIAGQEVDHSRHRSQGASRPGLRAAGVATGAAERITFHPTGKDAVSFDLIPGSAVLVEDSADEAETPAIVAKPN